MTCTHISLFCLSQTDWENEPIKKQDSRILWLKYYRILKKKLKHTPYTLIADCIKLTHSLESFVDSSACSFTCHTQTKCILLTCNKSCCTSLLLLFYVSSLRNQALSSWPSWWLGWQMDGRRGSESAGGCVDMDKFSKIPSDGARLWRILKVRSRILK